MSYHDFNVQISLVEGEPGQLQVRVLNSPAGQAVVTHGVDQAFPTLIGSGEKNGNRHHPDELGSQLFNAVFSSRIRPLWERSRGRLGRGEGLRLNLFLDGGEAVSELMGLPWELMRDENAYLCLSEGLSVVRHVAMPRSAPEHQGRVPPLRILVILSNPSDLVSLDLARERALVETLHQIPEVDIDVLIPATLIDLVNQLEERAYHILHFVGHGGINRQNGVGYLVLEDEHGLAHRVETAQWVRLLEGHVQHLRCVFLNGCQTAAMGHGTPRSSVAMGLVESGVASVVAMQGPITDEAAIAFSRGFYRALLAGDPLDDAVAKGRRFIGGLAAGADQWSLPVLFSRDPKGFLVHHHELHHFPLGPMIPSRQIPRWIIQAYAEAYPEFPRRQRVIDDAVNLRLEANPELEGDLDRLNAAIIQPADLPPSHENANNFWSDAFSLAGKKSPRLLAALIMVGPDENLSGKDRELRRKFLDDLSRKDCT